MGFKIKNSLTGEFEKLPILTLKGEKGETGGVEEYNKVDYMGNKYETLKQANDANVEYAVKTAIGEFNYLDYDGQHITATDTIEGRSKSAILSGQTLVNVSGESITNLIINTATPKYLRQHILKQGVVYTFVFDVEEVIGGASGVWGRFNYTDGSFKNIRDKAFTTGITKVATSFDKELNDIYIGWIRNHATGQSVKFRSVMILEGDWTDKEIPPYFDGMQSVKMPVLTTTGKNLFDGEFELDKYLQKDGTLAASADWATTKNYIRVKPNTTYTQNIRMNSTIVYVVFYDKNKNIISAEKGTDLTSTYYSATYTTPNNCYYIKTCYNYSSVGNHLFQIEEGSTATSYEPFKSNILTVNEDVVLRGIGDVRDELDLMTGELTQRIGEIVLDGSEDWQIKEFNQTNTECAIFTINIDDKLNNNDYNCDKFKYISIDITKVNNIEGIYTGGKSYSFFINVSKTKASTVEEFKNWLSNNNVALQYRSIESVKTVDLSGNHVYSYKGTTHYDCSSAEGSLVPTLFVKVPTDVQATIAQQRETIQTLNSENERLNQIQEALKASMLDSQVQLMNISWNTDFEVFTLRESIAPKDSLMDSRIESNIDKFSQAKFIIENDCPDLEKLNSQIEYYFSKDVFSQEQFEELTDLISIVKGENGCEY